MEIRKIVEKGELEYTHHYMQTMTNEETCENQLLTPTILITIVKNNPDAKVVIFGDGSLGIEINAKTWAIEMKYNPYHPHAKQLPKEVWQYCRLAMGLNGDTNASIIN